jgi:hypothetical protein
MHIPNNVLSYCKNIAANMFKNWITLNHQQRYKAWSKSSREKDNFKYKSYCNKFQKNNISKSLILKK